ncbi:hypothetical protein JKG68_09690 [Microvirga aerilata]|uniref:Uncharacterized protein n=1 Tax=Microvirga aerilata TaxID=670292 RepID=A0A936Z6H8_9HYPH|nr:hypothetical protein [Microvirga aerilata]MBL0404238.1 hypothetical protein [Microvirga aerilata]
MLIPEFLAKLAALKAKTQIPANMPVHIVDAVGLSEERLGYPRFPQELTARREWIAENCYGAVEIEPIRDAQMRLVGRRFIFANLNDATYYKLRWSGEVR